MDMFRGQKRSFSQVVWFDKPWISIVCIRSLDFWSIGCIKNDKKTSLYFFLTSNLHMMLLSTTMLANPCVKSINHCWFHNKSRMSCGKIFRDKAWNILPHHILFPWGRWICWGIFHDVTWNIFKDAFLLLELAHLFIC